MWKAITYSSIPLLAIPLLFAFAPPAEAQGPSINNICTCRRNNDRPPQGDFRYPRESATMIFRQDGESLEIQEFVLAKNPGHYHKVGTALERCQQALGCCVQTPENFKRQGRSPVENMRACAEWFARYR